VVDYSLRERERERERERTSLQPLPAKADELGNGFSFSESIHVLP